MLLFRALSHSIRAFDSFVFNVTAILARRIMQWYDRMISQGWTGFDVDGEDGEITLEQILGY
jgi:hypothetical protein